MTRILVIAVAGLMASAASATSLGEWLTSDAGDPYGAASIQDGRYVQAEKRLDQAYARGEREPELLLNLAALRARSGKNGGAQDLYREVLQQPNMHLVTVSGTSWSHDIAQRGLGDR